MITFLNLYFIFIFISNKKRYKIFKILSDATQYGLMLLRKEIANFFIVVAWLSFNMNKLVKANKFYLITKLYITHTLYNVGMDTIPEREVWLFSGTFFLCTIEVKVKE